MCFCLRYSTPFFEMVSAEHFFFWGGLFITLDYRIVYAKVPHTIWLFVSTVIYYGFVTVWHALTPGILRLASVLSWCMICPQRLQLLTVLGYLLFLVAVNPQLHLFEICLLIDKDIENDSIFGENVLQELEDRARSLKAFRYIVYWMWQLLQGLCIIQSWNCMKSGIFKIDRPASVFLLS